MFFQARPLDFLGDLTFSRFCLAFAHVARPTSAILICETEHSAHALNGVALTKRRKTLRNSFGSARMSGYTAYFTRAVLMFAVPVPNLPVLGLPI